MIDFFGCSFLNVLGRLNTGHLLSFAYEDQSDTAHTVIPEPGSVVMWLSGTGLLTLYRRERNRINGTKR
ncbi:MAG: PEP-CTERM sorting domain-containing protein [Kiritimatiellaceae bacterium]|nr:MAG: PEP-CTERM sorting domain-containing protein [Kiritimatiellaceae bacterium]